MIRFALFVCLLLCGCTVPPVETVAPERPKDQFDVDESDWALSEAEFKNLQAELREEIRKRKEAEEKASHEPREMPAPVVNVPAPDYSPIIEAIEKSAANQLTRQDLIDAMKRDEPPAPLKVEPLVKPTATGVVKAVAPDADGGRIRNDSVNLTGDGRLIVYWQTRPDCEPCVTWKAEGSSVRIDGQPVWWEPMANSPKDFQIDGFPFFAWRDASGGWWTFSGWYGIEAFEEKVNKANSGEIPRETRRVAAPVYGRVAAAAPVARTIGPTYYTPVVTRTVARMGYYPVSPQSTWWTGSPTYHHLLTGEHSFKFDATWLASLSYESMQSLHAADHEGRVQWQYVVRPCGARTLRGTAGITALYRETPTVTVGPPVMLAAPVYAGLYAAPSASRTRTTTTQRVMGVPMVSRSRTVTRESCPGGVCPTSSRRSGFGIGFW